MKTEINKMPTLHNPDEIEFFAMVVAVCTTSVDLDELKMRTSNVFANKIIHKSLVNWKYGWNSDGLLIMHKDEYILFVPCDTTEIFDEI